MVHRPDVHHHRDAFGDAIAAEFDIAVGPARCIPRRREQPQRFLNHLLEIGQAREILETHRPPLQLGIQVLRQALLHLRILGE